MFFVAPVGRIELGPVEVSRSGLVVDEDFSRLLDDDFVLNEYNI